jgi:hypothetical protein
MGCPSTDLYVMDNRQATQAGMPTPEFRVISFPREKVIQINFLITDSINQMPDSIRFTSKYYTYPLVVERLEKKKDTAEYYYFKDLKMGDFKWYKKDNAEKITVKMYRDDDSTSFVYQKSGEGMARYATH